MLLYGKEEQNLHFLPLIHYLCTAMRDDILITVIIPVYQAEDTVGRTLESVYSQGVDEARFEVIAVNDGSTDGSMEIVRGFAFGHPNLKILEKKNEGVSAARNDAMHDAAGEYLLFLDADDALAEGSLRDIFEYFDCEEDGDPELVVMRERTSSGKEKYSWKHIPFRYRGSCGGGEFTYAMDSRQIFSYGYFRATVTGLLFRRNSLVARCIHFDPGISLGEDLVFINMLLPFLMEVVFWNRDLYVVYERPGSASRSFDAGKLESCGYTLDFLGKLSEDVRGGNHLSTLAMLDYAKFKLLMFYMKQAIRYRVPGALGVIRRLIPEGYLPLYADITPKERWKMRVLNRSVVLFYRLLELQNMLSPGRRL